MFTCREHKEWPVKEYGGIKCYSPPSKVVPSRVEPGKYEGGFQLWECTLDLLKFMETLDLKNKCVYELGCGWGLPGIYAALRGAQKVVLQDYNRDVIEEATIPNCGLNGCPEGVCEFSAHAWADIPAAFPAHQFDIVLASETIYRKEQLDEFMNACKHLVKDDGMIIIAAKRMYFGLSGSVFDLIDMTKGEYGYEQHENKGNSAYVRDVIVFRKL